MKFFLIFILSFFLISCAQEKKPIIAHQNNSTEVVGLNNETGSFCYLNSVIQALSNLSQNANFLERDNLDPNELIMKNILSEYKKMQKTGQHSAEILNYKRQLVHSIFTPADRNSQNCPGEVLTNLSEYTKAKEIISIFNNNDLNNLIPNSKYDNPEASLFLNNDNLYIIQLYRQGNNVKVLDPMPIALEINRNANQYKLSAIIMHQGNATNHGHYTALLIKENKSFYCDDVNISDGNAVLNEIVRSGNTGQAGEVPYFLFYEKI